MTSLSTDRAVPASFQDDAHGQNHDYLPGSPHLKHAHLRAKVIASLQVLCSKGQGLGQLKILEVGAGHGTFTDALRSFGAQVTVTEMSLASVEYLSQRYSDDPNVEVVHDQDGSCKQFAGRSFDAVVCVSVLHHIPDYLAAVRNYVEMIRPGGSFVSWQDPILYARVPPAQLRAAKASYYLWRATTGEWSQGLKTASRRIRGVLDEANTADMVEYHVIRDGVDERALQEYLASCFDDVNVETYWSTQALLLQSWGDRRGYKSTFGVVAQGRKDC
jgi:SAM-dependent methyltransferase